MPHLQRWIADRGGRSMIWKTGHSVIKAKMRETGALLAGEFSGHIFFMDRWYGFDDGLYAGARLLELVSHWEMGLAGLASLPCSTATPELRLGAGQFNVGDLLKRLDPDLASWGASRVITVDGLRIEYEHGFALIRMSNTTPDLIMRFDGDSPDTMRQVQESVRSRLSMLAPELCTWLGARK